MLDLKKAREELAKKSYRDIQEQTAWSWASRAVVSYQNVLTTSKDKKIAHYLLGEEYFHEAIEHAALVETGASSLLSQVQAAVAPYSIKAWEELESLT